MHSCFNLIYIVPDQVINWVGGHAAGTLGRDDNEKMKNALNVFGSKIEQNLKSGGGGGKNTSSEKEGNGMKA
ncbi:hypothetical protein D3C81_1696500 [compost metagenome]